MSLAFVGQIGLGLNDRSDEAGERGGLGLLARTTIHPSLMPARRRRDVSGTTRLTSVPPPRRGFLRRAGWASAFQDNTLELDPTCATPPWLLLLHFPHTQFERAKAAKRQMDLLPTFTCSLTRPRPGLASMPSSPSMPSFSRRPNSPLIGGYPSSVRRSPGMPSMTPTRAGALLFRSRVPRLPRRYLWVALSSECPPARSLVLVLCLSPEGA